MLPSPIIQFESTDMHFFGINRYWGAPAGMQNYFLFAGKGVNPPGEIRSKDWVWMELARRLGFADKYCPKMLDVTDWRDWDEQVIERIYKPAYEEWAKDETACWNTAGSCRLRGRNSRRCPSSAFPASPGRMVPSFKNTIPWGRSPFNALSQSRSSSRART